MVENFEVNLLRYVSTTVAHSIETVGNIYSRLADNRSADAKIDAGIRSFAVYAVLLKPQGRSVLHKDFFRTLITAANTDPRKPSH